MGFEVDNRLESLRANGRYRTLRVAADHTATSTVLDGQPVHIFSSNDYLGLAADPTMKTALAEAGGLWNGRARLL